MTWDYPFWLISGISLPLIVLLHLLVRRRKTLRVPSLVLWERLLENERRSVSFRRLLADALLLLQLLAAVLLVLALSSPRPAASGGRISGPTVLVLDVSASMNAADAEGRSRFQAAMSKAADLVKSKSAGSEVMIVTAGAEARPQSGFLSSKGDLLSVLDGLRATDEPGHPRSALRAAEALAGARTGGRVLFITDGAFDDGPIPGPMTEVLPVGTGAENIGISTFAVRGNSDGGLELLVSAENFGSEDREARLQVELDGAPFYDESFSLEPSDRTTRTIAWQDAAADRVTASLTTEEDDRLSADNEIFAVLARQGRIRTALITPGNWFLETLLSAHPGLSLEVFTGLEEWDDRDGSWDLIVADRIFPPRDPGGAIFAIYPFVGTPPPLPLRQIGQSGESDPVSWDSGHPVTRDVDLSRVSIRSSALLEASAGSRVLAESTAAPLVLVGEDDRRRWVALSFDLLESSLPLRPAFPILVSGAVSWLVPGDTDGVAGTLPTGMGWRLPQEFSGEAWEVFSPDGREFRGLGNETTAIGSLDHTGVWTAWSGGQKVEIGVNLLDGEESNLTPRWFAAVRTPDNEAFPDESDRAIGSTAMQPDRPRDRSRPLTGWLLALALAILLAEWWLQGRQWRTA